jgi:hypothetical protein
MEDRSTDPGVFAPPSPRHPAVEVRQFWGDTLLAVRHARRSEATLALGAETGWMWRWLGVDLGFVTQSARPLLAPLALFGSEVAQAPKAAFLVPEDASDGEGELALYRWVDAEPEVLVPPGWSGASAKLRPGSVCELHRGDLRLELRLIEAPPRSREEERADLGFAAILSGAALLGASFAAFVALAPPTPTATLVEVPDRVMKVVMVPAPPPEPTPVHAPAPAGGGRKAKGPEGEAGRPEARLAKASGRERADQARIDRQVAENAGILGVLSEQGALAGLSTSTLDPGLRDALGGLSGPKGVALGRNGLGERGNGPGGGGIEGTGIGTVGDGPGAGPGHGPGGHGDLGPRGEGVISSPSSESIVLGCMERSAVDEVVRRHLAPIRYCYQRRLQQQPELAGKIVTRFTISADGSVASAAVKTSTLGDDAVDACVAGRFAKMTFPALPPGCQTVVVSYPFLFSPE